MPDSHVDISTVTAPVAGMADHALLVSDLSLIYPGGVEALRNVSLSLRDGEFVSIVGPSGCGKSSLLKLILGLEKPSRGEIHVSGRAVRGPEEGPGAAGARNRTVHARSAH